jgi:DnaJ-class molecular chaperone
VRTLELPSQEDWELLGIDPTESLSEAKRKYRLAARASHPDVAAGDAERFRQATEAWRRVEAALQWRDAHDLASAVSVEEEEAGEFDETLDPDVPDWGAQGGIDVYATAPLFERFVRRFGRAVFLSGRFPEREWSTVATLAASTCLALVVHADVHPAWLAYSLASLVLALAVGRTVSLPARLGL